MSKTIKIILFVISAIIAAMNITPILTIALLCFMVILFFLLLDFSDMVLKP